ncbi:hypothetical protein K491DRAFT_695947 [Lophiostoma macrostomum CBS 122681]|uniref:Uncharacterized protein n=1 Tax=Lophiostoma macrostomum CBS 122681 TaxID=1314788 RepID=A0A6A6T0G6_9PLEO|nr:hypothetical protein K491DRAFT_695947 [Lophiostoma macrostomum CBS 122681]
MHYTLHTTLPTTPSILLTSSTCTTICTQPQQHRKHGPFSSPTPGPTTTHKLPTHHFPATATPVPTHAVQIPFISPSVVDIYPRLKGKSRAVCASENRRE